MMPQAFKAAGYRTYGTGKLLHSSSRGLWDEEFFPKQRWSPFVKDQVLYTEKELPTKGTSNPRHVIKSGPNGREYVLPLNRMPSDRRPNLIDGESFDWGAFDIEDGQMGDGQITDWVCDRLSQYRKSNASNPFFLAVGYYRPHIPLYAPSRYFKNYPEEETVLPPILKNDRADLPETAKLWVEEAGTAGKHATVLKYEQHKAAVAAYLACITFIDTQVGRLIEALNDTGQADNTIVVLWSDHGWHLGEKQHWGKWTGWERSTRVPLIFAAGRATTAKQVVPNRQCSAPVSLIDMYPTLVEMCNLPKVAGLDGQSLVGLLNDPSQSTGRVVVTTFGEGNYSLRNTRYRYIRYADGSEELYDHKNDPNEWKNRAEDPQLAHVKNAMKQELPSN